MPKPHLSTCKMVNLNIGMMGLMFGWMLQVANMSGIYAFYNAKEHDLGLLWLALPVVGMLTQPVVGYLSDHCKSKRFGKRLPFIFWGGIATAVTMIFMPNAPSLFIEVVLLCVFTAAINVTLQPFRPLASDVVPNEQLTKSFSVQACLSGIGSALAAVTPFLLLFLLHATHQHATEIPYEIKLAFYIGAAILVISVTWTTLSTRKYFATASNIEVSDTATRPISSRSKIRQFIADFATIPRVMREIFCAQFFVWMGVFSFIIYLTPAISQAVFRVSTTLSSPTSIAAQHVALEKSMIFAGIATGIYTTTSIVFAYFIPQLNKFFTRKTLLITTLFIAGASLLSFNFTHNLAGIFIGMIGIGIAWAATNSIPYAIIASHIPEKKSGFYLGVFNIAICVPQIVIALAIGGVYSVWLHHSAINVMLLAGAFFAIGAILTMRVRDC